MSDEEAPAVRTARRVKKLLTLHHKHGKRHEELTKQLAEQTARQVERIVGNTAANTAPQDAEQPAPENGSDWPALEAAARLARELPSNMRNEIVARLPPGLSDSFLESVFSFDALPTLSDRDLQTILQRANKRQLAIALLGAPERYFHAVTRNMSTRAAQMLREDMEGLLASGELRTRDVQDARTGLSSVIREVVE